MRNRSGPADFDHIIGDGTLWLVVMGSLAMMEENQEDRFARSLALCDVARLGLLSSNADSENSPRWQAGCG
jgi:hypothetical protein